MQGTHSAQSSPQQSLSPLRTELGEADGKQTIQGLVSSVPAPPYAKLLSEEAQEQCYLHLVRPPPPITHTHTPAGFAL
jgi:hypothetical protein